MGKILIILLTAVNAFAVDETQSYDEIINSLSNNSISARRGSVDSGLKLDDIRLHASVGAIASRTNLRSGNGLPGSQAASGAELVMGIDLFSREWLAEGVVRSFHSQEFMSTDFSLREFDLRVIHEGLIGKASRLRLGSGLSSRYITFSSTPSANVKSEYTTPAFVVLAGFKYPMFAGLVLLGDITYRSSMVTDTIDKGAVDAGLRIGGSF